MSSEAMTWALELAPPMPAHLVATLAGLARHADKKGRNSYPSIRRLAAYACKAERSVARDLKELRTLGLIRPGDPRAAALNITISDPATPTTALTTLCDQLPR
ncbi:helix-turn-helix domain-containing protein, partial [Streptomyces sp. NPDC059919]|uniref:helix-turn-helix domain-containing protein n=1 Tax=Streptomyces sp. NPDC059919 TaxID=3347004 RepID=UPI00364AE1F8